MAAAQSCFALSTLRVPSLRGAAPLSLAGGICQRALDRARSLPIPSTSPATRATSSSGSDGTRTKISDGVGEKSFDVLLDTADIDDMFSIPYLPGPPAGEPALNDDPGRVRNTDFFIKMYGDCRDGEVSKRMKNVRWVDGSTVRVTNVNGVADRLQTRGRRASKAARPLSKIPRAISWHL